MKILYEDNHVIVAVKPQNIPTQADSSGDVDFLSMVKEYVKAKYNKPGAAYIGLVHRLDRPAGGVMVFARTSKAAARIGEQLKNDTFQKTYYALVTGKIQRRGVLQNYLRKDREKNSSKVVSDGTPGAKYAELSYEVLDTRGEISMVKVALKTGRSHQIRVQMAYIGAPLLGDIRYGGKANGNLCLWSQRVGFVHPTLKCEMEFCCDPPNKTPWNLFSFGESATD